MAQDNFNQIQWSDQVLAELIQQALDQISSVDTLTDSVAVSLTNLQEKVTENTVANTDIDAAIFELQQFAHHQRSFLQQTFDQLQQRIHQLTLLYTISNQYGEAIGLDRVLSTTIDSVWQKMPLRFAVVLLGETELGPYTYHAMRGVPDSSRFLHKFCPFPLWGVLARALLPRLSEDEPDYLLIRDICTEKLPLPEEFPWLQRDGSLMILPLRADKRAQGAILLGSAQTDAFGDLALRNDILAIAKHTERVLQLTHMQQELNTRSGQLLSLQLFTKSIASVRNYDKLVDVLVRNICEAMGDVGVTIIFNNQLWHHEMSGNNTISPHIRRIIDWAMQAGQPIFYDPSDTEGSLERFYYNESGHALVVPILGNEQTQGAIQIASEDDKQRFEEGDMIVLRTIANCAAIVLQDMKR